VRAGACGGDAHGAERAGREKIGVGEVRNVGGTCPAIATRRGLRGDDFFLTRADSNLLPRKKKRLRNGSRFLRSLAIRLVWPGRRMGAKATPKKRRKATIVPFRFRRRGRAAPSAASSAAGTSLVHRPRNAVPVGGRYCVQAAMKSRCASPRCCRSARRCDSGWRRRGGRSPSIFDVNLVTLRTRRGRGRIPYSQSGAR